MNLADPPTGAAYLYQATDGTHGQAYFTAAVSADLADYAGWLFGGEAVSAVERIDAKTVAVTWTGDTTGITTVECAALAAGAYGPNIVPVASWLSPQ